MIKSAIELAGFAEDRLDEAAVALTSAGSKHDLALSASDALKEASNRTRHTLSLLTATTESLQCYLDDIRAEFDPPARSDRSENDTSLPGARRPSADETLSRILDEFAALLPNHDEDWRDRSSAALLEYCRALAVLAKGLSVIANTVTGSISFALDRVAEGLRRPMISPSMDIVLDALKQFGGGGDGADLAGKVSAEKIVLLVTGCTSLPLLHQLKLIAFLLRTAGIVLCYGEGRPLLGCPCLPDFMADAGTTILDITSIIH